MGGVGALRNGEMGPRRAVEEQRSLMIGEVRSPRAAAKGRPLHGGRSDLDALPVLPAPSAHTRLPTWLPTRQRDGSGDQQPETAVSRSEGGPHEARLRSEGGRRDGGEAGSRVVGEDPAARLRGALDHSLQIAESATRELENIISPRKSAHVISPPSRGIGLGFAHGMRRLRHELKALRFGRDKTHILVRRAFAYLTLCGFAGAVGWLVVWLLG
jgi:hypothetical protein